MANPQHGKRWTTRKNTPRVEAAQGSSEPWLARCRQTEVERSAPAGLARASQYEGRFGSKRCRSCRCTRTDWCSASSTFGARRTSCLAFYGGPARAGRPSPGCAGAWGSTRPSICSPRTRIWSTCFTPHRTCARKHGQGRFCVRIPRRDSLPAVVDVDEATGRERGDPQCNAPNGRTDRGRLVPRLVLCDSARETLGNSTCTSQQQPQQLWRRC